MCARFLSCKGDEYGLCGRIPVNDLTEPDRLSWRCQDCIYTLRDKKPYTMELSPPPYNMDLPPPPYYKSRPYRPKSKINHIWIPLKAYMNTYQEQKLYAFAPARGPNKGEVCGASPLNCETEPNRLKWRC